jgi:4-hydroxy-2-oxoheptanedioate aldolase
MSLQPNRTKAKLRSGNVVIGSLLYVPSAKMAELVALCGFDFIVIDQEHGPIGPETAEDMVRACELSCCTPIVRVRTLDSHAILQALDGGAVGIHIPSVSRVEQARLASSLCRYAPTGTRGLAGVRAADYGMRGSLSDYCKKANDEVLVVAHIEDMESIHNLDGLLGIDGIDVYYLGPTDLSNSLGRPGSSDPAVSRIVDDAICRIVRAGRTAGTITTDPKAARRYIDMGVRYLATHALRFMVTGSQEFLQAVRS